MSKRVKRLTPSRLKGLILDEIKNLQLETLEQGKEDTEKVQAMELKIQAAQENLQKAKEAILFYENIIELKISTLDDLQKDISIIQDLLIKLRRPNISP